MAASAMDQIVATLGLSFDTLDGLAEHLLRAILATAQCTKGLVAGKRSLREDQWYVLALRDATPLAFPEHRLNSLFDPAWAHATSDADPDHSSYHALIHVPLAWRGKVCGAVMLSNTSGLDDVSLLALLKPLVPIATSNLLGSFWSAREASDAHQFFLAMMSHEIRTPLCGVIGMSRLLQSATNLTPEQREYVDIVYRCGFQLLEIINDILDYSKMDAGRMQLEQTPFGVRDAVHEALEVVGLRAQEHNLAIKLDLQADVPEFVLGDRKRYRQVLINLLTNAIKFTEQGQVICRVRYDATQGHLVTEVEDTGIGIDAADFQRIFQTFVQIKGTALEASEGTGLGLAICKRLVELMNGQIGVKESKVGVGTCMAFRLPLPRTDALDEQALQALSRLLSQRTVLILDGNVSRRIRLSEMLMRLGARLLACSTVEEGQLYVRNTAVDVVVVDPQLGPFCPPGSVVIRLVDGLATGSELAVTAALHQSLVTSPAQEPRATVTNSSATATEAHTDVKILVVEDNDTNMRVAVETLRQLGYAPGTVHTAANGILAVHACQRTVFDVILMDLKMPVMDGFQATRLILEHYTRSRKVAPTVIAMTAFVMGSERDQCKQAGMKGFLPKPLLMQDLQAMLDVVWKRRKLTRPAATSITDAGVRGYSVPRRGTPSTPR